MDWYETVPAGSVDGPYGGDLVYRIDDAHATPQGSRLAPHTAFAASPSYSDPAYVSPYQAPSSPAPPAAEAAWDSPAASAAASASQAAWAAATVPGTPAVLLPPPQPPAAAPQPEAVPHQPEAIAESAPTTTRVPREQRPCRPNPPG